MSLSGVPDSCYDPFDFVSFKKVFTDIFSFRGRIFIDCNTCSFLYDDKYLTGEATDRNAL